MKSKEFQRRLKGGGEIVSHFTKDTNPKYLEMKHSDVYLLENLRLNTGEKENDAERLQLRKGHMVYIEGKIRTRHWEKDGIKRYAIEIIAENMTMLSKRDPLPTNPSDESHDETPPMHDMGGDLPF